MENSFSSLDQIRDEFNLEYEESDKIRVKLREMQSSIHPDRNKGVFPSESDETLFHKISNAIQFIDQTNESGALVPISAVTDLTKAVTDLINAQTPKQDSSLSEQIKGSIESYSSRFKMPKIALSAITVALSAVWLFPKTIQDHPILGKWLDISSNFFQIVWLYVFAITILFWVISWMKEEKQKNFQESLKTEMVQNEIFRDFLNNIDKKTFTIEDFVEYLMKKYFRRHSSPFLLILGNPREISLSMAHTIADVIIKRGLSRQAIKKKSVGNISETYTLLDNGFSG